MDATTWQHPDEITAAAPFEAPGDQRLQPGRLQPDDRREADHQPRRQPDRASNSTSTSPRTKTPTATPRPSCGRARSFCRPASPSTPPRPTASASAPRRRSATRDAATSASCSATTCRRDLLGLLRRQPRRQSTAPISATADRDEVAAGDRNPARAWPATSAPRCPGGWIVDLHRRPGGDRRPAAERHRHRHAQPDHRGDRRRRRLQPPLRRGQHRCHRSKRASQPGTGIDLLRQPEPPGAPG